MVPTMGPTMGPTTGYHGDFQTKVRCFVARGHARTRGVNKKKQRGHGEDTRAKKRPQFRGHFSLFLLNSCLKSVVIRVRIELTTT